jgi:sugar O-acyltransferase (sialic acid O-acetyltransferase NeuD family)
MWYKGLMATPIKIPLINSNEPEAVVTALHIREGQHVSTGDLLCTLETTKSNADIYAEGDGTIAGLRFSEGQQARAGEVLCFLAETQDWAPPAEPAEPEEGGKPQLPAGLRITRPALTLARQAELDLSRLPIGPLVTESLVKAMLDRSQSSPDLGLPESPFDPTAIIVYGGGGHGKSLIDLLRSLGVYRVAGIIDDGLEPGRQVMGVPVLGGQNALPGLAGRGIRQAVNAVGGLGDMSIRIKVFHLLGEAGFTCPAVVHPSAFVEASATLSPGAQVFPHAYVGSEASIGFGSIVNTGAIVSHDCRIGSYVNISPGAMLAGEVHVGDGTLIGMGVTVNLGVKVGAKCRLGNGSTVKSDVPTGGIVRAGTIWPS